MAIDLTPLSLPASADASKFADFGREVKGVNPGTLTPEQFQEIQEALYKVCFRTYNLFFSHSKSQYS
jgi:xanthine dioxygenase